jgi:uncharacterized protein
VNSIEQMLSLKTWAVIGANNNKEKCGCKIFRFLLEQGDYNVFPVNPGMTEVLGKKCYSTMSDLPEKPDVVNLVVPPRVGEQIIRECAELGIKNVWFQPGTDTEAVVFLACELGLNVVQACVMVECRNRA